ncbi:hypothetical protein V5P93_004769 [Actinokineospora auranticolor]|uniref:Uncharacterized protein n=1 Tax=Actinokineospora auranticolor TaxID=155976 RepID=A0A2S6GNB2_9PSEU|nr:hypothetical protein [Actinokineospora auranticolor]PPK66732.1 hypothetical protein CLV40_109117 [Actinokineospora auranticolor]
MTAQENTRAARAAAAFVAAHGAPTRAVVANIGRAGARVVLVGKDGTMGDVIVPDTAAGESLVAEVSGLEAADWDRETTAATRIGSRHRAKMAARTRG